MLWYRLISQVFVLESQHHSSAGDVLAAGKSSQVRLLPDLASHLGALQHSSSRCQTSAVDYSELTKVETWWYGDDSPHLADS